MLPHRAVDIHRGPAGRIASSTDRVSAASHPPADDVQFFDPSLLHDFCNPNQDDLSHDDNQPDLDEDGPNASFFEDPGVDENVDGRKEDENANSEAPVAIQVSDPVSVPFFAHIP
jgi:hypothetical protein